MALESATYIDGLVTSNPTGSDNISDGDEHIRLIKTVLKNTLPDATAAIKGIRKITHFQSTTGVDVRSASFTNVYEFAPVKDSATTDLIIIASVGSDAWNYNTSQTSTYRIYDNDNTAAVGNEYQGVGWQFPGAGDGTGSGGNKGKADVTLIVTESTPLSAGTKTFKIQAKCGNPTDGGISSNNFTVLVLEVPA